ncbi:hypothetical protein J6590_089535 [Homalodisca vitripennis]|nr:hypothetical protein J6590_089535 [Homalodisca vitripennis]
MPEVIALPIRPLYTAWQLQWIATSEWRMGRWAAQGRQLAALFCSPPDPPPPLVRPATVSTPGFMSAARASRHAKRRVTFKPLVLKQLMKGTLTKQPRHRSMEVYLTPVQENELWWCFRGHV